MLALITFFFTAKLQLSLQSSTDTAQASQGKILSGAKSGLVTYLFNASKLIALSEEFSKSFSN